MHCTCYTRTSPHHSPATCTRTDMRHTPTYTHTRTHTHIHTHITRCSQWLCPQHPTHIHGRVPTPDTQPHRPAHLSAGVTSRTHRHLHEKTYYAGNTPTRLTPCTPAVPGAYHTHYSFTPRQSLLHQPLALQQQALSPLTHSRTHTPHRTNMNATKPGAGHWTQHHMAPHATATHRPQQPPNRHACSNRRPVWRHRLSRLPGTSQ